MYIFGNYVLDKLLSVNRAMYAEVYSETPIAVSELRRIFHIPDHLPIKGYLEAPSIVANIDALRLLADDRIVNSHMQPVRSSGWNRTLQLDSRVQLSDEDAIRLLAVLTYYTELYVELDTQNTIYETIVKLKNQDDALTKLYALEYFHAYDEFDSALRRLQPSGKVEA